ncbi:hypothetical protein AE921_13080 [Xanthomonas arboricola]|nr:hypothetical protein AE921_13080 [Xanthomonas arboricola]KOB02703.1 hypothetical protein AE920_02085 [Xanthomonas arboricola]KOB04788.1 hypothetical protein AE922_19375 [Xanthomonas arboricola]KOB07361.1 hypothetical protein AE923_13480 [Xanthomonas arboricola]KOB13297.1 hypothetical protein AE925_21330 [Xanthomonas arboricola]
MRSFRIESSDLPGIEESVRECINRGQWLLFRSGRAGVVDGSPYFLKAGREIFKLDSRGSLLEKIVDSEFNLGVDEVFYFSDIPQPDSLSNGRRRSL